MTEALESMKLQIDDHKTLAALQSDFANQFPFLKIEFFTRSHKAGQPSAKSTIIDSRTMLHNIRQQHNEGDLFISKDMTVAELERLMDRSYGLHIQVFRKSGKLWLETTATDNWTLEYQNAQGAELQHKDLGIQREESDYHEQE